MPYPPGPAGTIWTTLRWMREPYMFLEELQQRYGDTFSMKLAAFPRMLVVSNPEHVREVFSDDGETLEAGRVNRALAPLLGERSVLARLVSRTDLRLEGRRPIRMVRRSVTITPAKGLRVVLERRRPRPAMSVSRPSSLRCA